MAEISDVLNRILVASSYPDVSWIQTGQLWVFNLHCLPVVLNSSCSTASLYGSFSYLIPLYQTEVQPYWTTVRKTLIQLLFLCLFSWRPPIIQETKRMKRGMTHTSAICQVVTHFIVIFTHKQTSSHTLLEALANCHFVLGQSREGRRGV